MSTTLKPWENALRRLKEGNQRFVEERLRHPNEGSERRLQIAQAQHPFATIFACSDSREAPEIIFDRGLGDLFVVRTAGHALDRAALGSIEFSIEYLHVPLVVVMGHERCGAVKATLEALQNHQRAPNAIQSLVNLIRPAFDDYPVTPDMLDFAIQANIRYTVRHLVQTPLIASALEEERVWVVGAYYDLDTGVVRFG